MYSKIARNLIYFFSKDVQSILLPSAYFIYLYIIFHYGSLVLFVNLYISPLPSFLRCVIIVRASVRVLCLTLRDSLHGR